jgi:extradiol dioxygenase family protein
MTAVYPRDIEVEAPRHMALHNTQLWCKLFYRCKDVNQCYNKYQQACACIRGYNADHLIDNNYTKILLAKLQKNFDNASNNMLDKRIVK